MSTRDRLHVVVAGAGPSGLMAAQTLAIRGVKVTLVEPNRSPGRKFLLAGRSGLNLTHSEPLERLLERYAQGTCAPIVRKAIEDFPPALLRQWAQSLGEETTVGTSGRVFPKSWRATPLLRAWISTLGELGVTLHSGARVVGIEQSQDVVRLPDKQSVSSGLAVKVETSVTSEVMFADGVILALGGTSWPTTGSDGLWQKMLSEHGVAIEPFRPSNAGVRVEWSEVFKRRFEGCPIKYVSVGVGSDGTDGTTGDVVVSASGLVGGPIYTVSSQIIGPTVVKINLRPDDSIEQLAARLAKSRRGDSLRTTLRKVGLSDVACGLVFEFGGREVAGSPELLAKLITGVPIPVSGTEEVGRAISVSGGICARSVDERFMLRELPGVFTAGEMLDWDAPTGGYLLQACF